MRKNLINLSLIAFTIIAFNLFSFTASAQEKARNDKMKSYFYVQPNLGFSQYFGDINKPNLTNNKAKFGFGGILGYQVSPVFGVRGQFVKTKLSGERTDQNLKFNSDLWDAALNLTLNVNNLFSKYNENRMLNFYLFSGAGLTSYKSTLESITPQALVNQHTSRQKELFVPAGAGASVRLNHNLSVNLEYGDHITFKSTRLDFTEGNKKNDHYTYISAGLQIKLAAKDTDRDGVKDKLDLCPNDFGKIELAGCPDNDNDGIADKDDACPDIAGKAEFKGCPDTDGDNIPDKDDACPGMAGKADLFGCPDRDGDGIADKDDKCPEMAGSIEFKGCPDRDGDGIIDIEDACPDVKGLAHFAGCPDTDNDGIPDNKDKCPEVAGVAANNGCPEIIAGPMLEKTVYFAREKSGVLESSMKLLDEIVVFINEHPDASITVSGYASDPGTEEYNLRLSEKRADYVINYLKKKGVTSLKFEKLFFGEGKPIGDNNTAEGRALNRRVEIKITK